VGTQDAFFEGDGGRFKVNGSMMMTGMSKNADSGMMQAKN
jgi:hypothetical protein